MAKSSVPAVGEIWVYGGKDYYLILARCGTGNYNLLPINLNDNSIIEEYDFMLWKKTDVWKKL